MTLCGYEGASFGAAYPIFFPFHSVLNRLIDIRDTALGISSFIAGANLSLLCSVYIAVTFNSGANYNDHTSNDYKKSDAPAELDCDLFPTYLTGTRFRLSRIFQTGEERAQEGQYCAKYHLGQLKQGNAIGEASNCE